MLTPEQLQNAFVLIEIGAKAASADKPLRESAEIQAVAVAIIEQVRFMNQPTAADLTSAMPDATL